MFLIGKAEGRGHRDMGTLLPVPMGLLSGLLAQSEISELLDELYYDSSL
jgi:hypothetical protein